MSESTTYLNQFYHTSIGTRGLTIHYLSSFAPTGDIYKLRPLLYYQPATEADPERLIIQYSRRNLTGYLDCKRSANIPPLTEAQAEALDAVQFYR